jgi:hypothetical protein
MKLNELQAKLAEVIGEQTRKMFASDQAVRRQNQNLVGLILPSGPAHGLLAGSRGPLR